MFFMILGVDEVGRGCWAGPLCVGAVVLNDNKTKYKDSKQLTGLQRTKLSSIAKNEALSIGIGWASSKFIDQFGISAALTFAAKSAISQIRAPYDEIIIDGNFKFIDNPKVTILKKADQLINSVSAASIIAKVARDKYMHLIDGFFPGYGFIDHVGYGTKAHRNAIGILGPCTIHRTSFAPLQNLQENSDSLIKKSSGRLAENAASKYLQKLGLTIIETNWKTKWCEIDIIASLGNSLYFVEVKYRKNTSAGTGLEYITSSKLKQMKFAADLWLSNQNSNYFQPHLSAVEVAGLNYSVTNWIKSI